MRRRAKQEVLKAGLPEEPVATIGNDFAWKVHSAITDWTAKVDTKASIILGFGGVIVGFIVTLSANGRRLASLQGADLIVERIGVCFVLLGVLLAALVVAPRLNARSVKKSWKSNFIYFGHIRHWPLVDLRSALDGLDRTKELDLLAAQLSAMSKIAWLKHRILQCAMLAIGLGVALVFIAAGGIDK